MEEKKELRAFIFLPHPWDQNFKSQITLKQNTSAFSSKLTYIQVAH